MAKSCSKVLIALGSNAASNWGDVGSTLRCALEKLLEHLGPEQRISRFYETPAFPAGSGPAFINSVVEHRSDRPAPDILQILHQIEAEAGRARDLRWGPRCLDLDLLAIEDHVYPSRVVFERWRRLGLEQQMKLAPEELILPHPRLQDRAFVLGPLLDIAEEWQHPILGKTVRQMWAALPQTMRSEIVALPR